MREKPLSKTPSPIKDRIKGSKVNKKGSAASSKSAFNIEFVESTIKTLENKRDEYNAKHPNNKVTLATLKAVFRRGAGAYSTSHRPNITRSGWAFARVNKFLLKKGGTKVKAAYVQDDDLMKRGAILDSSCKTYISENKSVLKTGYYLNLSDFSSMVDPYGQIPLNLNYALVTYNSGNQDGLSLIDTINPINLQNELADILNISINKAQVVVGLYIEMGKKLKSISQIEGDNIIIIDRDKLVCKSEKNNIMEKGGLIAPNGKNSNLTPEQYKLVRTSEFKAWFGDWENNPENASKVVDDNGEPLVVYHGSIRKFDIFNTISKFNSKYKVNWNIGSHFGNIKQVEQLKKETPLRFYTNKFFLNIRNINRATDYQTWDAKNWKYNLINLGYIKDEEKDYKFDDIIRILKKNKLDGFVYYNLYEGFGDSYIVFQPNQIKLADGSNTTFDAENPDIRYEQGGNIGQEITCVNCGWHWNTNQSDEFDKYICHKCGFDNRTFYDSEPIGYNDGGMLKEPHTIYEIAKKHGVSESVIENALREGIKTEKEHTNDKNIAETIALQHLWESPKYYEKLKIMEKELNLDEHYEDIRKIYAIGGVVDPIMSFSTPSGEPTKLTYLQQVLVRTQAFKNWFGDWESAAKQFILNGRQDYVKVFKNVSKVVDKITFEPKVVYHGTRTDAEFFIFDVSKKDGVGRPYGYFAHNEEYSRNFTTSSQRSVANSQPFMYKCFASVKNPFYAIGHEYYDIQQDAEYWTNEISISIARDKYGTNADDTKINQIKKVVKSQIGSYIEDTFAVKEMSFWLLMARDVNKNFKFFLNNYNYDGVFYAEEFGMPYDIDNPAEFTEAVTVFEPKQVKLADGRNINFDPMNEDIRFKDGGKVSNSDEIIINNDYFMGKRENLRNLLTNNKYAEGGEVVANKLDNGNNGKKGGYFEGRSHADGGIKAYNKDTGQMIEVEGQEVIITKGAVNDTSKREFEGEMLTNREILSRINQSGGGVSFEKGGQMAGDSCGCSGKKYKYGGEMIDDYSIVKMMNEPFKIINDNFADARAFADMLVQKLK